MNDCTNAYCLLRIGRPPKQHTNGPCKCLQDVPTELRIRITRKLSQDRQELGRWSEWADEARKCVDRSLEFEYESEFCEEFTELEKRRPDREE